MTAKRSAPSAAPRNVSADEADSPASFQPLKAHTSAGARSPSGRRSQRSGCIPITVADRLRPPGRTIIGRVPTVELSALRPGDEVAGVYACTRKDRLTARTGTPYLALELRDRTGALPARVFRDADLLGGRFERGDLVRVQGRVERFRDELQVDVRAIERADGADPATFLPVAYRNLDELDGFLEHLAREVHEPGYRGAARGPARRRRAARRVAPRAVHARRPPRVPRRAAGAHGRGRDARAGDVPAAPAAQLRPADLRRARPRPRQDARVHLRGRDRADRGGPAARPRRARARSCSSRGCATSRPSGASRCCTACSPTTARRPRPAGASARPRRSRSTA